MVLTDETKSKRAIYDADWRRRNPEKHLETQRRWIASNPERVKARKLRWNMKPETIEKRKEYYRTVIKPKREFGKPEKVVSERDKIISERKKEYYINVIKPRNEAKKIESR